MLEGEAWKSRERGKDLLKPSLGNRAADLTEVRDVTVTGRRNRLGGRRGLCCLHVLFPQRTLFLDYDRIGIKSF